MVIRSVGFALSLPLLASFAMAADDDHVVTNVVNGLVYVSLGARDGAAAGKEIELLAPNGATVGVLVLSGCGEVTCKAPLSPELAGKIVRGERVRLRTTIAVVPKPAAPSPPASASATPPQPTAPPPAEEEEEETPPAIYVPPKAAAPPPPKLGLGSLTVPVEIAAEPSRPWKDGDPVPLGYRRVHRVNTTLTRWGWLTFSISYGLSTLAAFGDSRDGGVLLLPLAGPWVYLASKKSYYSSGPGDGTTALLGIGQDLGALLLIFGYGGKHVLVPSSPGIALLPVFGAGTYGAAAVGTF
jgi:hypothetical protein